MVITNYNYEQYLKEAIKSALAVSDDVIVVDDCSTDNSFEIYKNIEGIGWAKNAENLGVSSSRNLGVAMSKYDYIVCLDADDTLNPEIKDIELNTDITAIGVQHFEARNDTVVPPDNISLDLILQNNQMPVSSPFSKAIWRKVGGFKTMKGYEDWDFWVRCLRAGATIRSERKPLLNYRIHAGGRNVEAVKNHNELLKQIHENNK